ncbi:MAG: serine/threonine protein kinase [Planctomycetaceae bacterium]|nr:serine/threonine protein kinase [Planctomycetaceae bacterium]
MPRFPAVLVVVIAAFTSIDAMARDWPGFRGPSGNGITDEADAPLEWSATKNIKWKVALPRSGNGSPIVSNARVFVTSAEDTDGKQRSLYCFDRKTGKQHWVKTVEFGKKMITHPTNPYCGTTPVANGERVVVWHNSAGLYCYDFEGHELWSRDLGEFRHIWGYGTSPVIYNDKVMLNSGPGERIFMTAISLEDGKTIWQTDEPHKGDGSKREDGKWMGSWSTPVIAEVGGKDQVICTMPKRVVAYDPNNGSVIWSCDGIRGEMGSQGDLAYSSPVIVGDICVAIGGYSGPAIGVRLGGSGNVTEANRLWRVGRNPQSIGSGVAIDGYLYRPNARPGTIECLNPKTGEVVWSDRGAGAVNWGSIVYAAGRCYVTNQKGATVVFAPNPESCKILAKNELGEGSNATPAISDGEIFVRTFEHLYCISE